MIEKIIFLAVIILLNIAVVAIYRKVFLKRKLKTLIKLHELFDRGLHTEAIAEAEKMLATSCKPLVYEFIGDCYFELGNSEESLKAYETAISLDETLEFAYIGRGKLMMKASRVLDAINDFKKALRLDSNNTVAKYYLALAYEHNRDYEAAIRELTEAKEISPSVRALYEKLEDIYLYLGRKSDAEKVSEELQLLKESGN